MALDNEHYTIGVLVGKVDALHHDLSALTAQIKATTREQTQELKSIESALSKRLAHLEGKTVRLESQSKQFTLTSTKDWILLGAIVAAILSGVGTVLGVSV
jgi:hypothetical protein